MKNLLTILALTLSANLFAHSHTTNEVASFEYYKQDIKATLNLEDYNFGMWSLRSLDVDILGVDYKTKKVDVLISERVLEILNERKFNIDIEDENAFESSAFKPDTKYQNPAKVVKFLKEINAKYPSITNLYEIGKTLEGRSIYAIKISDNPGLREPEESTTLFNSMHHAREVMTPEVSVDIISYLVTNYSTNAQVKHWVDSNEIWVVPMLNMDGNNKVWTSNNMWRKNTRNNHGVDLNRNYPHLWGKCNGSSGSRNSQTYRGTAPASEPETQALMALVKKVRPVFDISYHSYSELVIYPYGCKGMKTETWKVVEGVGKELGSLLNYTAGTAWEILYSADGGDIDWMYKAYQVIPFVLELNSRSQGFHPPYSAREATIVKNRKGWMHLLNKLDGAGLRGNIMGQKGRALALRSALTIKVETTTGVFQDYTVNPDGSYHIVLPKGNFTFSLFADGVNKGSKNLTLGNKRVDFNFSI
jgi:carboxypeptidase T